MSHDSCGHVGVTCENHNFEMFKMIIRISECFEYRTTLEWAIMMSELTIKLMIPTKILYVNKTKSTTT